MPTDAFGNPNQPVTGTPTDSLWGQAMTTRGVPTYPTTAQRDIHEVAPHTGRLIYNEEIPQFQYWNGSRWQSGTGAAGTLFEGVWQYDTGTGGDPGPGDVQSVTGTVWISTEDNDGINRTSELSTITVGNQILFRDAAGGTLTIRVDAISATAEVYTFDGVVVDDAGFNAGNNDLISVTFMIGTQEHTHDYLPLDGSDPMEGPLDMGANRIENVASPNSADDAMPRFFADTRYLLAGGKAVDSAQADNADALGNLAAAGYARKDGATFTGEVSFTVGSYVQAYDTLPPAGGDLYGLQQRNIIIAENVPSAGTGKDGDVCLQYQFAGNAQNQPAKPWVKVAGAWRGMS